MPDREVVENIQQAVEREHPAEEKMPAARVGEGLIAGNGQPTGKGARRGTERALLNAEVSGGVDLSAVKLDIAARVALIAGGADGKKSALGIRRAAPIEIRVGIEDLQAAHKQNHQRQRVDPVGRACDAVVAVDQA